MKMNWKFAIMAFAALAMVSCGDKGGTTGGEEPDPVDPVFVSLVDVTDNSIAEWANLPAEYLVSSTCADGADMTALKSVKVYSDQIYLNILFEFDEAQITNREWVPVNIFVDADGSAETGGYDDFWSDATSEILLQASFMASGEAKDFDPSVFKWYGTVGGTGWLWTNPDVVADETNNWGAAVGEDSGIGKSQIVDGNKVEIQLLRELIPTTWGSTFKLGIELEHIVGDVWNTVGYLPNAAADATTGARVKVGMLSITTNPE